MAGPMATMAAQNTTTATPSFPLQVSCKRRRGGASGSSSNCGAGPVLPVVSVIVGHPCYGTPDPTEPESSACLSKTSWASGYFGCRSLGFDRIEAMSAMKIRTM